MTLYMTVTQVTYIMVMITQLYNIKKDIEDSKIDNII